MNDQATNAPPIDEQLCEEAKTEFARLNEEYQHACIGRGEGAKDDVAQELNIRKFKDLDEFQEATTKALTDIVEVLNNR